MRQNPNRTVLLTTHYMFEADELCDHVAVINRGQIVAQGTPNELKRTLEEHVRFQLELGEASGKSSGDSSRGEEGHEPACMPAVDNLLRATDGRGDVAAERAHR